MKTSVKAYTLSLAFIIITVLGSIASAQVIDSKSMVGAWGYGPPENKTVMITTDKIFSVATYDVPGKKFISAYGGSWRLEGNKMIKNIEWHSQDSSLAGKTVTDNIKLSGKKLVVEGNKATWNRLDDGTSSDLTGAWIITGNYNNDKVSKRANPFTPRRTMKVLSGNHFHWIAYNVANNTFINAGGGTFSATNGKYTENIEFFTKTPESIGKSLVFDYSFVNGDWRHKGQKSTGGSMDECWSRRETLEK